MKKRLLGVLLALVALGAMAGSAFAADATGWDITVTVTLGSATQTVEVTAPDSADMLTSEDNFVASADTATAGKADTSSFTVSSDTAVKFSSEGTSADVIGYVVGTTSYDVSASYTVSADTTIYLQVSADVSGDVYYYPVKLTFTVNDGSSVTPTPDTETEETFLNANFPKVKMSAATTDMKTGLAKAFGNTSITFVDLGSLTVVSGQTEATSFDQKVVSNSASLTSNQTVKAVLPRVKFTDANAYFAFMVVLSKVANSDFALYLAKAPEDAYSASVEDVAIAADTMCTAVFVDEKGNELTTEKAYSGNVGVGAQTGTTGTFVPYILQETTSTPSGDTTSPKSGNSGCDMGMGSLALLLAAALPLLRKVR